MNPPPAPCSDDTEMTRLREENARLRALVGPLEQSYDDLRAELVDAEAAVRSAEAVNGELRGEILEITYSLDQARHNLGSLRRLLHQRSRRGLAKLTRPLRRRWNDRRG